MEAIRTKVASPKCDERIFHPGPSGSCVVGGDPFVRSYPESPYAMKRGRVEPSEMHVGIFGPGRSGKTTLAKHLSQSAWAKKGIRSICWDINGESWGDQAIVFFDESKFWRQVWTEKSCLVFVDEAAETIKRDDGKTSLFTRIRHRGHKLVVIGHSGINLLPVQREQISTVYLFRQRPKSAELWVDLFTDERIRAACTLRRYEFLECHLFGDVKRRILAL